MQETKMQNKGGDGNILGFSDLLINNKICY